MSINKTHLGDIAYSRPVQKY